MGAILGGGPKAADAPKLAPAAPPPPKITDNAALIAAQAQVAKMRRRSTALADPTLIAQEPNKAKKTALGV